MADGYPHRLDTLFVAFQSALVGRYSLQHELGRGGMGIVYLAHEVQLDRSVAIKLLPPERAADDRLRERFLREARLAAKLSHPNIIPIFAVDECEGFVFYVMAYVDGETLAERVRVRGPMAASEATRVLREVAWALGHAHAQGVVHRDVKPENILLERGSGRALVTDFGIAAAIGADESPAVAGTPEYMSPEQALGKDVDARSDLYALGATAYFVVSGRPPFVGESSVDVVAKHVTLPVPAMPTQGIAVPRKLTHLIEKSLAKEPGARPQSALVLAEQLGAAVEQRREIPAALRAFVKREGRILGPGSGGVFMVGYFAVALTGTLVANGVTPLVVAPVLAVVLGLPFTMMVMAARKLLRRGFALPDVRMAFEHEIGQLREEFFAEGRVERRQLERAATVGAVGGATAAVTVGGVGILIDRVGGAAMGLLPVLGRVALISAVVALGCVALLVSLRSRRPHAESERWLKFWTGRIGRAAFTVAGWLGGKPQHGSASTHRATEMAIGLAAEELYKALPKDTRRNIGDVPAVVAALQKDATTLRAALDKLEDSLAQAGEAASSDGYAEIRALRDEVRDKHRQLIATLETTRLNLLRLHAGAIQVDGFTTHLGEAEEVADEVKRLLEARGELDRFMRRVGD